MLNVGCEVEGTHGTIRNGRRRMRADKMRANGTRHRRGGILACVGRVWDTAAFPCAPRRRRERSRYVDGDSIHIHDFLTIGRRERSRIVDRRGRPNPVVVVARALRTRFTYRRSMWPVTVSLHPRVPVTSSRSASPSGRCILTAFTTRAYA